MGVDSRLRLASIEGIHRVGGVWVAHCGHMRFLEKSWPIHVPAINRDKYLPRSVIAKEADAIKSILSQCKDQGTQGRLLCLVLLESHDKRWELVQPHRAAF